MHAKPLQKTWLGPVEKSQGKVKEISAGGAQTIAPATL
jgi:hypothetical protein